MVYFQGVLHPSSTILCTFLVIISVISITGRVLEDREWKLVEQEPCLAEGGICVKAEHCKLDARSNTTGLCHMQDSTGVCCFEVPDDASCSWKGGACMEECGLLENYGQRDCPEGKKCCPLIL